MDFKRLFKKHGVKTAPGPGLQPLSEAELEKVVGGAKDPNWRPGGAANAELTKVQGNSYNISELQKTQPYIYSDTVSAIKDTICKNGPNSVPPIEIRVHNGVALVVDGHHRLEAFRQLGYIRVPIKYLHSSQLGKVLPDGTYYRSIKELLDVAKISKS